MFIRELFFLLFQTRSSAIECQTNGIEQTTLAGSSVARDGKKASRAQRLGGEVYGVFSFERSDVAKRDGFYRHVGSEMKIEGRYDVGKGDTDTP